MHVHVHIMLKLYEYFMTIYMHTCSVIQATQDKLEAQAILHLILYI